MTIERPMLPPAADERCQIIQFSTAARVSPKHCKSVVRELEQEPERPARDEGELSTTCKNSRLRQTRDKAWNRASRTTSYWRVRLDWHSELKCAQQWGLADSGSFPPAADENRISLVEMWREAVVKQLLTPAPNVGAVAWKRAKLSGRDFRYLPVKPDRVERAIADDVAFLAAHPTRRESLGVSKTLSKSGKGLRSRVD
jgi:hypothetical protein